jgi:hypothetical protein
MIWKDNMLTLWKMKILQLPLQFWSSFFRVKSTRRRL